MESRAVSENVSSSCDGHWEWFRANEGPTYKITGKYLFYSADRDLLVRVVVEELEEGGFHRAKIKEVGKNIGPDYVLCLYYKDDCRKYELGSKYRHREGVRYRYWKSDEATRAGQYSKGFLEQFHHSPHRPTRS